MSRLFFFLALIIFATLAPVVGALMATLEIDLLPAIIATPVLISLMFIEIIK